MSKGSLFIKIIDAVVLLAAGFLIIYYDLSSWLFIPWSYIFWLLTIKPFVAILVEYENLKKD